MNLFLAVACQVQAKRNLGSFDNATHTGLQLIPSKLEIRVVDELGNLVKDAQIAIYMKKEDYLNSSNSYQSGETNEKEIIKFKKIKPVS